MANSTPNGFDPAWVEAINEVMSGREVPVRIVDLDPVVWDTFIGPMCDAIEHGEYRDENLDREMYSVHPDDVGLCSLCGGDINMKTAHRHQGRHIGDECCWDERLRSSE